MNKKDSFWVGVVRKHKGLKSYKQNEERVEPSLLNKNPVPQKEPSSLADEIEKINKKNEEHLKIQPIKVKKPMGKLSMLLIFLGLMVVGFLFFIAGFLVCYSLFPPFNRSYVAAPSAHKKTHPSFQGYAGRQSQLEQSSGIQNPGPLSSIEEQSEGQAKRRTHETLNRSAAQLTGRISSVVGANIASVIAPVVNGIAGMIERTVIGNPDSSSADSYFANEPSLPQAVSSQATPSSQAQDRKSPSSPMSSAPQAESAASGKEAALADVDKKGASDQAVLEKNKKQEPSIPKAQEKMAPSEKTPSVAVSQGVYTIEVENFKESETAYNLLRDLQQRGYDAYIVRKFIDGQMHYSVRFGNYETFLKAKDAVYAYRGQWQQPARIIIVDPQEERINYEAESD